MKVTQLPYIPPRKTRIQETNRFTVKWTDGDMVYFQNFKRDSSAVKFLNKLVADGYQARILMK
jgi:ABC-type uncharacterized transport system auxiliary subunit